MSQVVEGSRRPAISATSIILIIIDVEMISTSTVVEDAIIPFYLGIRKKAHILKSLCRFGVGSIFCYYFIMYQNINRKKSSVRKDQFLGLWQLQMHLVILISKEQS
jgi:hypothetical protein